MAELVLYKKCKINPNENFILKRYFGHSALDEYLSTLTQLKFTDVRFTQNKLDIEVIVQLSRDDSDMANRSEYNYVSLQEKSGATIFYYFITKMAQVSSQSVKLYLHLDVLNSFAPTIISGEFGFLKFSKLTHITRQHKDRYKPNFVYGQGTFYAPHIDEYTEGLTPILYKKAERTIYEVIDNTLYNREWYIVYRSNTGGGVTGYIFSDSPINIMCGGVMQTIGSIKRVDLKLSSLVKVFRLPYMPFEVIGYGTHEVTGEYYIEVDDSVLSIGDYDTSLTPTLYALIIDDVRQTLINPSNIKDNIILLNPLCNVKMNNDVIAKSLTDLRSDNINNIWEEPKLYHSDFYYNKYVYDSFSKVIKNESYLNDLMTLEEYEDMKEIKFIMTSTINSNFMFEFTFLAQFNFNSEDYEKILFINRNNEMTIYNNEYLNYLKSGYNYDVKNKNRQEAMSWFTTGVGLTAGVLSLIFGSKTLGAGLVASSVLSIANSINNTIQLETSLEQKLDQLKRQSTSVFGADDVDLLANYCKENKMWVATYEVSDRMKNALSDLFYYTGYIDDVTEVPNVTTRMWFNFLQCEPHFDYVNNISAECLEELINKYKGGVTYLHKNIINNVVTWDFDRVHENWESVFFS